MKQSVSSGTLWLMGSEIAFMLSNYLIHIGLARHLGAEAYGIFGVLISLYLINRAFLNTGLPRAVSKFLSEFPDKAGAIFKTAFRIQLVFAIIFAFIYIIFAPLIARILKDNSLTYYIIFLGIMVIPLALLALYTSGYLNGLRLFREQAYVKTGYPILRLIFTIILVWLGWALWGALVGYFLAILVGLLWSHHLLRKIKNATAPFPWRKILTFAFPITIGSLAFTLLRNVNVLFLKSMLADNRVVGLYTAAFTLSTITYMVFTGLPLTLTPSVSRAMAAQNWEKVRMYIRQSLRYLLLLLLPVTALMAATSRSLLELLYSAEYGPAAPVLSLLLLASAFLAMFSVFCSIVTGSGNPRLEMIWCLGLFFALAGLNIWLIPRFGMIGSAWASVITSALAMTIAGCYVFLKFRVCFGILSLIRISMISAIIFIVAQEWQYPGAALAINYLLLSVLYLVLLFLFGEIGHKEYIFVSRLFKSR